MNLSPRHASHEVVTAALARLRENGEQFEAFCLAQLEEFERLRQQLQQREHGLTQEQSTLREAILQRDRLLAESHSRTAQLQRQLEESRHQAQSLAEELEVLRRQGEAQGQQHLEQRAEWVGELLRTALDVQSQMKSDSRPGGSQATHDSIRSTLVEAKSTADTKAVKSVKPARPEVAVKADPVLKAVMAQFEKLKEGRERPTPANPAGGRPSAV